MSGYNPDARPKTCSIRFEQAILNDLDATKVLIPRCSRSYIINALLKACLPAIRKECKDKRLIPLDGIHIRL